jgi:hypothetical protein
MPRTIVGTFENLRDAREVAVELCAAGFAEDDVAILAGEVPGARRLIEAGVPAGEVPRYVAAIRPGAAVVALRMPWPDPLSVATDSVLGAPPLRQPRVVA